MGRRLSFLICGAQKSGTSALHQYLRNHPEINLPQTKELHIFDNELSDWSDQEIEKIDRRIEKHYERQSKTKHCGEATPNSMWWEPSMKRIWRYNPEIRLIAVLRNPITRAYANWRMEQLRGRDNKEIPLTLEEEEINCRKSLPLQDRTCSYLSRGFYTEQIRRVWRYFPREQFLAIKQDDLLYHPVQTLQIVYHHLQLEPRGFEKEILVDSWESHPSKDQGNFLPNPTDIPKAIPENIFSALFKIYDGEIKKLEKLLGWDCKNWINHDKAY
ncbi:hypothetical protein Syncc9902_0128 [Synechococcus sp. CC9902]|uniref:sulfotransferase family protein n=1 Tax=Synechococcus sp. (strain CC9902) TaxID=316279 RepID=UPI00005D3D19|nr:sulfotransferase [Synechococcus sp. CC9902]ABB25103.1 hypothetical protein Syncc9902_0128 [Synechococcus sp. CC9902]